MDRLANFKSQATHPWLGKVYKRLKPPEIAEAVAFIEANVGLDRGAFDKAVNRMFLDRPNKPKNWTLVMELLCNCNVMK